MSFCGIFQNEKVHVIFRFHNKTHEHLLYTLNL